MLGKLFKHDWKTVWKVPTLLIGILLFTAILAGSTFALPIWDSEWIGLPMSGIMLILVFYFAMIASSLGIVIYLAVRFYKSMYTDEGYLTHTLPVTAQQLIQSKMLVMILWNLIAIAAIFLSLFIFGGMAVAFLATGEVPSLAEIMRELQGALDAPVLQGWRGFCLSLIFMTLAGSIGSAATLTGAISLGQMIRKHRVLGAIGAYFAINCVAQMISTGMALPFLIKFFRGITDDGMGRDVSMFSLYTPVYTTMSVVMLLLAVVLYFVNVGLVKKQLELE